MSRRCVRKVMNPIHSSFRDAPSGAGPESITTSREYGFSDAQLRIVARRFRLRAARFGGQVAAPRTTKQQETSMASIHKDIPIEAPAHEVWDAVRDFGALHTRLVPGFVLDTRLEGDVRIVTFANGTVAREQLVGCDDARRRLAYAISSERVRQHSAAVQIVADGERRCRMLWTTDVLPHEIAPYISAQMDQGAAAVQRAFAKCASDSCPHL